MLSGGVESGGRVTNSVSEQQSRWSVIRISTATSILTFSTLYLGGALDPYLASLAPFLKSFSLVLFPNSQPGHSVVFPVSD